MRVRLFRTGESEHVLVKVRHRIIGDGWSDEILMRELITAYEAFTAGRQPQLPELPIQYRDFAHWQREILQGESLARQLEYWRSQLADLPGPNCLVTVRALRSKRSPAAQNRSNYLLRLLKR
jgi:hypothetical protein